MANDAATDWKAKALNMSRPQSDVVGANPAHRAIVFHAALGVLASGPLIHASGLATHVNGSNRSGELRRAGVAKAPRTAARMVNNDS